MAGGRSAVDSIHFVSKMQMAGLGVWVQSQRPRVPPEGPTGGPLGWVCFEAQAEFCTLTYLFSHPGHILREVAYFPGQETLSGLQEREKPWVGKGPASPHPSISGIIKTSLALTEATVRMS